MVTRRLLLLMTLFALFLGGCGGAQDSGDGGTVTTELLVGSAGNGRILRYNATTGAYIGVFCQGDPLVSPNGIAQLTNGDIVVGDFVTRKVLIYTPEGTLRQDLGARTGRPYAILALDNNNFLVSEYDSAPTGRILRWAPSTGFTTFIEGGQLDGPDGMAIRDGELYVSSQRNKRVLRYNASTGAFLGSFAVTGFSDPLAGPSGLTFGPGGNLYVTQHDNDPSVTKGGNVLQFNGLTGALDRELVPPGRGGLSGPVGILLASGNRFLVTSAETNNVLQFDANGNFLGVFAAGTSLQTPIYMAFRSVLN